MTPPLLLTLYFATLSSKLVNVLSSFSKRISIFLSYTLFCLANNVSIWAMYGEATSLYSDILNTIPKLNLCSTAVRSIFESSSIYLSFSFLVIWQVFFSILSSDTYFFWFSDLSNVFSFQGLPFAVDC